MPPLPQFVADGVFFAELNEMLTRELAEDGFSGVEVRTTPLRTEIIIRATRTQNVLGASSPLHVWPHPEQARPARGRCTQTRASCVIQQP